MIDRLRTIRLRCQNCGHTGELEYQSLEDRLNDGQILNLMNLNTLVGKFQCRPCGKKDLVVEDSRQELLFDSRHNVVCEECGLPIPFPRLTALPGTRVCASCKNSEEDTTNKRLGSKFPEVPPGMRGRCTNCNRKGNKGIVVVYQNSMDKSFFLGCSTYPKCTWSTDKYSDQLNAG